MRPDECLKRYRFHDWQVSPGGTTQINPFTGKSSVLRMQMCKRCGTSEMFFEDVSEEAQQEGEQQEEEGMVCYNCGVRGGHAEWCKFAW